MRPRVVGTHRRQRSSPRSGRGAVWAGLFLLLVIFALIISRDLWAGLFEILLGRGPRPVPQAAVDWESECPAGVHLALTPSGVALLAYPTSGDRPDGSPGVPTASIALVSGGTYSTRLSRPGSPVGVAFRPPDLSGTGTAPAEAEWVVVLARSWDEAPGQPGERAVAVAPGGGERDIYALPGAVVTVARGWFDGAGFIVAFYFAGVASPAQGLIVAVGDAGQELWSRVVDSLPVHRVAVRSGVPFVAAATPNTLALLDARGNLLWSKTIRGGISDIALQSHGGPAVVAGGKLFVYDRRGNLLWKKTGAAMVSVACAAKRIAVAGPDGVMVYDEDGLEKWSLACPSPALDVELDWEAGLVAVVLDSGRLVVARAPGLPETSGAWSPYRSGEGGAEACEGPG